MDQQSFDRLARVLGGATDRREGLKRALAAVLGGSAAVVALEERAEAKRPGRGKDAGPQAGRKKRRKTCKPACTGGYICEKVGRKRACVCPSGVTCGAACCAAGQACEGGACTDAPEPAECVAAGEPCKDTGRRCCDGRVCASGQGGDGDVACYVPKTGACTATADCVYGMSCQDGRCAPPPPAGLAQPCDAAAQQLCTTPGATCAPYTGPGAPGGAHCTLPVGAVCTTNPECGCYQCFYPNGGAQGGSRGGRASATAKACCYPSGHPCQGDGQCCTGLRCVNGACAGTICAPAGGDCSGGAACCDGGTCTDGVCGGGGGGKQLGDPCEAGVDTCPTDSSCTVSLDPAKSAEGTRCLLPDGMESTSAAHCVGNGRYDGKCVTCTVYGGVFTGDTGLKAKLEAAAADPGNSTKNPVYVGAGEYTFTSPDSTYGALYLASISTTHAVKIFACGNGDVTFDGGSPWTSDVGNTTKIPTGSEWGDTGQGLLSLWYDSPASETGAAGFEIDGIDFQNARNPQGWPGGLYSAVKLKVANSTFTRCKGRTGAIQTGDTVTVTLRDVEIAQCYGAANGGYNAGGAYLKGTIELENLSVTYSASDTSGRPGGVYASLESENQTLVLKGKIDIQYNATQGLRVYAGDATNTVTCSSTTGAICGNGATPSGTTNCSKEGVATYPDSCNTICKSSPATC